MKYFLIVLSIIFLIIGCNKNELANGDPHGNGAVNIGTFDGTADAPFGELPYRIYYPEGLSGETYVIHVSRGGFGGGDDRGGKMLPYVESYVEAGYVVVQVDHRRAGMNAERIAQYRGEEISFIAQEITDGTLNYGEFQGSIDGTKQGFSGHSGGCMEGLEAAGTAMTHGNYFVPEIKAVFGMSPAGYKPDQFGIKENPVGFSSIEQTAVFVIIGEQEKDENGIGKFMATDWRLQAYEAMDETGPRFQVLAKGSNTDHSDIRGDNADIQTFNIENSIALFDTYVKGIDRTSEIGTLAIPSGNEILLSTKGK